jgi:hypothetical protein
VITVTSEGNGSAVISGLFFDPIVTPGIDIVTGGSSQIPVDSIAGTSLAPTNQIGVVNSSLTPPSSSSRSPRSLAVIDAALEDSVKTSRSESENLEIGTVETNNDSTETLFWAPQSNSSSGLLAHDVALERITGARRRSRLHAQ